jgi:multidrug efflux pump subunit AcrB
MTSKPQSRDPFDVVLVWTAGLSAAVALALSSTLAPLFYALGDRPPRDRRLHRGVRRHRQHVRRRRQQPAGRLLRLQAVFGGMRLVGVLLAAMCGISTSSD